MATTATPISTEGGGGIGDDGHDDGTTPNSSSSPGDFCCLVARKSSMVVTESMGSDYDGVGQASPAAAEATTKQPSHLFASGDEEYYSLRHGAGHPQRLSSDFFARAIHPTIRRIWMVHFLLGLLVVGCGVAANGGHRKYVPIDPAMLDFPDRPCQKAYVNVHASSAEEPGAIVCCHDDGEEYVDRTSAPFFSFLGGSYEESLCSEEHHNLPFAATLTTARDAWLLPLIPIFLRLLIISFEKLSNGATSRHHGSATATVRRLVTYVLFMCFRAWALYILLNLAEDAVIAAVGATFRHGSASISSPSSVSSAAFDEEETGLPAMEGTASSTSSTSSCWYEDLLLHPYQRKQQCYGQAFDFSDHVVLFFGHILPVIIFEMLFFFIFPLWKNEAEPAAPAPFSPSLPSPPSSSPRLQHQHSNKHNKNGPPQRPTLHRRLSSVANLPILDTAVARNTISLLLVLGFIYVNFITFLAVHKTAAYFHTAAEVAVGYVVSLAVQLPLGYIMCSGRWDSMRRFVGLPPVPVREDKRWR